MTLIEVMIVVALLAIIAALVVPRFTSATEDARDTGIRRQLQQIRSQLELYRAENKGQDPDMTNWDALVDGDYLVTAPINALNNKVEIKADGDYTGGWVWRYSGNGKFNVFATNTDHTGEYLE